MCRGINNSILLEVLKEIRGELRDHRALLLEAIDQSRTMERYMDGQLLAISQRMHELKEELEQSFKSELMGLSGDP